MRGLNTHLTFLIYLECPTQAGTESRKKLSEAAQESAKQEGEEEGEKEDSEANSAKLLPLYKTELQNLGKRAKFAEASFMNLYRKLMEAPDPAPLLSAASSADICAGPTSG